MIALLLAAGLQGVELPRGEPPVPAARRVNVADFGARLEDDDRDDTPAVSAAIKAAGNDTTLYFPAGTYNVRWASVIAKFDGLSLEGDGPSKSILKRMGPFWKPGAAETWENLQANYATDTKILRIEDCRNMCIRGLGFDANGTPTFGGVGIKRPRRLHITETRAFDSRERGSLFGKDRFAWIIMGYQEGAEDIWFVNNAVEGLQTEMDGANHVLVERSVFRRSVKSPGLGFLSGHFSKERAAPGFHNTHITVRRNYFTNSDVLSMGMLTFQLDPSTNWHTKFQDIDVLDNVFVYDIDSSQPHVAIKLGTGDSSEKTKGNVFERFRIEGNRIYRSPRLKMAEKFNGYLWFNANAGEERLSHTVVRGNRLYADAPARPFMAISRVKESVGLVLEDNTVHAYEEPPAAEEVTKPAQDGAVRAHAAYAKGQKFSVTVDLEFAGAPNFVDAFGMAKLHATLSVTIGDGDARTAKFEELSGKGLIRAKGERQPWSYDLQWKAGSAFRKTLIGRFPAREAEDARNELGAAFEAAWTVKLKPFEAALEGKPEQFSFLRKWAPQLFLVPGPLPFKERQVMKGQTFEEGGFSWKVEEIQASKDSRVAVVAGEKAGMKAKVGVDSRGFVTSLELETQEEGGSAPALKLTAKAARLP